MSDEFKLHFDGPPNYLQQLRDVWAYQEPIRSSSWIATLIHVWSRACQAWVTRALVATPED